MFYMERFCEKCQKITEQIFDCDLHSVEACPDDCDLVENSAEYESRCPHCLDYNMGEGYEILWQ